VPGSERTFAPIVFGPIMERDVSVPGIGMNAWATEGAGRFAKGCATEDDVEVLAPGTL